MKKFLIILTVAVLLIVGTVCGGVAYLNYNFEQTLKNTKFEDPDLSKIADGAYTGSYKMFPVSAVVKATVKDHKITKIEIIKHDNGQGAPAEVIPEKVVSAQSLSVDTVSGATHSSFVLLKAIENALMSAAKAP